MILGILAMSGAQGGGGGGFTALLPFMLIIVIIYFLMIRPQARKQKEHRQMVSDLKKGDRVVTSGGIHGTVLGVKETKNTLLVKVGENTKLEIERGSITRVIIPKQREEKKKG